MELRTASAKSSQSINCLKISVLVALVSILCYGPMAFAWLLHVIHRHTDLQIQQAMECFTRALLVTGPLFFIVFPVIHGGTNPLIFIITGSKKIKISSIRSSARKLKKKRFQMQ